MIAQSRKCEFPYDGSKDICTKKEIYIYKLYIIMSSNVHARFNIKLIFNTIRANLDAPLIDR